MLSVILSGCQPDQPEYYTNPLDVFAADPFVLKEGGDYYLYGTSRPETGFEVWHCNDLINWQKKGFTFQKGPGTWGQNEFWAPEVVKYNDSYFLFYSASSKDTGKRICVARSDSPLGPFAEYKTPLIESDKALIDAHPFIDDDGRAYLYYTLDMSDNKISEIYVVELNSEMNGIKDSPVFCIRPSQKWEGTVWNEAPYVLKHDGKYYLMYSANCFVDPYYGVGYAVADNPKGPWSKYEDNPILKRTDQVSGPGHNSIAFSPGGCEMYIVYHCHLSPEEPYKRLVCLDKIDFVNSGGKTVLKVDGPTKRPMEVPE